jgi:aspartate kinase
MGDTTDNLIDLAKSINPKANKREMDMLLSTGEQVSVSLMAMALHALNVPAVSLNAFQVMMHSTSKYGNARFKRVETKRIQHELDSRKIVIVTGFQGINKYEDITTLGRGGSDTTAVALAAALHADKCEIYTDVDGVYTADPKTDPTAVKLAGITYAEILAKQLGVMDLTAAAFCQSNKLTTVVFGLNEDNSVVRVVGGEALGTLVTV